MTVAQCAPSGQGGTVLLVAHDAECVLRDEEMLAALGYELVGFTSADVLLAACWVDTDLRHGGSRPLRVGLALARIGGCPACGRTTPSDF
jgi:hypothetical protein